MSLVQLLDDGARYAPEDAAGLGNPLPMALAALQRLGADAARLQAFAAACAPRLLPAPAAQDWPAGDAWPGRFGDPAAWPAYRSLFADWLAAEGAGDVLDQTLPLLMPGCGAAAFHALVRTAHALQAGHAAELADGLAHWACRHLPLGALPARSGRQADPLPLLRRLWAVSSRHALPARRMQAAAASPQLQATVAALAIGGHTLERLARLSALAYAGSGSATALQLLTGCHAMRLLLPYLAEADLATDADPASDATGASDAAGQAAGTAAGTAPPALRWFWQAWATAVAAGGLQQRPRVPLQPWPAITAAALASDDPQLILLVDSCLAEEAAYGGDDWRQAASRGVTP